MAGYRRERQTKAERVLRPKVTFTTDAEIWAFWEATESLSPVFRDFCRLLLLNGGRRTETAKIEWSQIMDDAWVCPAIQTKMGRDHRVPLGPMSRALLDAQPRYNATNLVFPGRDFQPMSGWTQRLRALKEQLGEPAFGFHALRRTFRTGLTRLGVDYDTAEMMVAHKRSDLHGRYDQADLWPERVDAQRSWEEHIRSVVSN